MLKPLAEPDKRIKDWLTVQVKEKGQGWRLNKTQQFLKAIGATGKPRELTHRDLLGVKVRAFVTKGPRKLKSGEERIESRIARYLEAGQPKNDLDEIL